MQARMQLLTAQPRLAPLKANIFSRNGMAPETTVMSKPKRNPPKAAMRLIPIRYRMLPRSCISQIGYSIAGELDHGATAFERNLDGPLAPFACYFQRHGCVAAGMQCLAPQGF